MTQPAPQGVPAWFIRVAAALVGIAGPVVAWINPNGAIPPGGVQAAVILAFLLVGAVIFLVHLILAAVHEYGWTMNAVTHVDTAAQAEFKSLWPEIKQAYTDAAPALDQVKGVSTVISDLQATVHGLERRTSEAGLNPDAVVKAVETATGFTFPRAATVAQPAQATAQTPLPASPPPPAAGQPA